MSFSRCRPVFRTTLAATFAVAATSTAQAQTSAPEAGADPRELEVVVVTAERRAVNLQDVPASATVLSAEALASQGIDNVIELQTVAPSVAINTYNRSTYINIRGVGLAQSAPTSNPGVAYYIDGMFIPHEQFIAQSFYDIDSIEVLRGPQGTLTGQNSTGGAIYVRTPAPDFNGVSGYIDQTAASDDWYRTAAAVNVPMGETFAMRVSGVFDDRGSFTKNIGPSSSEPGSGRDASGRVAFRYQPSDAFRLDLRYEHFDRKTDYNAIKNRLDAVTADPFTIEEDAISFLNQKGDRASLELNVDLSESLALRAITSYLDAETVDQADGDRTATALPVPGNLPTSGANTNIYRGRVSWTVQVALDTAMLSSPGFNPNERLISVHGIEMVYIPEAAFTLGDPDTVAYRNFSFFSSDGNGMPGGLYKINSEKDEIPVNTNKGSLYYRADVKLYQGDQRGPVPATFPKGFQSFYIMKYELQQGQYVDFLNCLSSNASYHRVNFGGRGYYQQRGSIKMDGDKYIAGSPQRPCNFISWDDANAFAGWAGLRPMTELEFEKACRGPKQPIAHEYPWNTASKKNLMRAVDISDELVFLNNLQESALNENNRDQFGASYYWVMDLAGSLWERCVTVGDSTGRAFRGSHGDGMLAPYGFANNEDWPKGSTETSGFGFRGGGYYEHNMQYGGFNPHSPIGYRNFGSWPGGARSIAYSSRFVRTAMASTIIR